MDDLKFGSIGALTINARDGINRDSARNLQLWNRLSEYPAERLEIKLPPGFIAPTGPTLRGSPYRLKYNTEEGRLAYKLMRSRERNVGLARDVKELNRSSHNGVIQCEGCDLSDTNAALFDSHHLKPLAIGPRESEVEDFCVFCPTCHRWAHYKADDVLYPLSVSEIRKLRTSHFCLNS